MTGIVGALVAVVLAVVTGGSLRTAARVCVDEVRARPTVLARAAVAFVDLRVALAARVAGLALTREGTETVDTCPVVTVDALAVVDVRLTIRSLVT